MNDERTDNSGTDRRSTQCLGREFFDGGGIKLGIDGRICEMYEWIFQVQAEDLTFDMLLLGGRRCEGWAMVGLKIRKDGGKT